MHFLFSVYEKIKWESSLTVQYNLALYQEATVIKINIALA